MEPSVFEAAAVAVTTTATERVTSRELLPPKFSSQVLKEVARDLTDRDIISIMFLMSDSETAYCIEKLVSNPREAFLDVRKIQNWEPKLLESLLLTDNVKVLMKLGCSPQKVKIMMAKFSGKDDVFMPNLDPIVQRLYFHCEQLDSSKTHELIKNIEKATTYTFEFGREQQLELYFLYLLEDDRIKTNSCSYDLNILMEILYKAGYKNNSINCDYRYRRNQNETDNATSMSKGCISSSNDMVNIKVTKQRDEINKKNAPWSNNDKRICIIVNIEEFEDESIKPRQASQIDVKNLVETFRGCEFEIEERSNLNSFAMFELLEDMPQKYVNYGAIFLCIMSHGTKGHIKFKNKDVPLEKIEQKFCQPELENVFKFIILQACQGEFKGMISTKLIEADGIARCNPRHKLNYSILQATVEGFKAFRHTTDGSILIQAVCEQLKKSTPIEVSKWAQLVKKYVSNWNAPSEVKDYSYCQVATYKDNTIYDYMIPKYKNDHM